MNQAKIGEFIAACRKSGGWTQSQLAEELGITDKAVSKWERGKSMPDIGLFMPLCSLLGITLNELLLGEYIPEKEIKEKSDQVLMDIITNWIGKDKEEERKNTAQLNSILKLENVRKIYDTESTSTIAIDGVSFQISQGSFVGIMGASGSGKSTLLNMIATIDRPTDGIIEINKQSITDMSEEKLAEFRREHLGFIFQEYNLIDALTIYENIALALTIKRDSKENIKQKILELAKRLEISDILEKYPYEVSGGQRQRCACARAIAVRPDLILADEPTGALDSHSKKQLLETLTRLRREYGATILMVTHDALSASYCDRILFLQDGKMEEELERGNNSRQAFFADILEMAAHLEGADTYVL